MFLSGSGSTANKMRVVGVLPCAATCAEHFWWQTQAHSTSTMKSSLQTLGSLRISNGVKVDLNSLPLPELEQMLQKQQKVLNSPVSLSLPDKGAKLKKKVEEIRFVIEKKKSTAVPTIHASTVSSVESNLKNVSIEEIRKREKQQEKERERNAQQGLSSDEDQDDTDNQDNTEVEIEWLQRKVQFLKLKGKHS
jgi:hypothetical protein